MINIQDLAALKDKIVYDTNNDKYIVYEDRQQIINSLDYRLLGFQNDCSYANVSGYIVKCTLDGKEVSRIYLDVDAGFFKERANFSIFIKDKTMYKVNHLMDVEWEVTFTDYIQDVIIDNYDCVFILFKNSAVIERYSADGNPILYLSDSDDPTKVCRLFKGVVSAGAGYLYVVGNEYNRRRCTTFIDHYDLRKTKRIERIVIHTYKNVSSTDEYYMYKDLHIDGDFIYLYGTNNIEKVNLAARPIWKYMFGYNYLSQTYDTLTQIRFDGDRFKDRIYFVEHLDSTNGYSIGKLSTNGDLLWKLTNPEGIIRSEFNLCIYKNVMYVTNKQMVNSYKSFVLALDNNNLLFETRGGNLIRVVQYNYDDIYDNDNYSQKYLLGAQLKEEAEKVLTFVLNSDFDPIKVDDDNYAYLSIENPDIDSMDNYDYFRMIGSIPVDEANEYSRINGKAGFRLLTKAGSYIDTLYPYEPEVTMQFIIKDDGTHMLTEDEQHLIRSKGFYTEYFYILADDHMYHQDLCTKVDEDVIVTKRKEFQIMRKRRFVHRYILRTLLDMDIIVEHLEENGILDTLVPHYVEKLKHHTTHMIREMQEALSPVAYNIVGTKRYSYKYDGFEHPLRVLHTQIFSCKYIPYIPKMNNKIFIDSMTNLVEKEIVTPFVLFLDGKAIKWSDMVIVKDWYTSYIIISNCDCESERLDAILFPCIIRYGENADIDDSLIGMYFDTEGYLTLDPANVAMRIEVIDDEITGKTYAGDQEYIEVGTSDSISGQLSDTNNIFVFEGNRLFADSRLYLDHKGKNIYTYNHTRDIGDNIVFKTFYFNKANDSKNMLHDIPDQNDTRDDIIDKVSTQAAIAADNFMVPFDFKLTRDKTYLRNISEATRYILTYKMALLADYYRDQMNIKSFTFTGERAIILSEKTGGLLFMPRQMHQGSFDYVIVFHNDELYEYNYEVQFNDNEFMVPIFTHVKPEDKLEIVHFMNVVNVYAPLRVTSDKIDYLSSEIRYNDFELFGNTYSGSPSYPKFNTETNIQYKLNFAYRNVFTENGLYKGTEISLDDEYYMNKWIQVASTRQFRSMYRNILDEGVTMVDLEPTFRFCRNKNQYLVFINNRRINNSEWILSDMNEENHTEMMYVIFNKVLDLGDKVDIIYIPEAYEEIVLEQSTSVFGDIIIDISELGYSFDKNLFMIFVDGHKINPDNIDNISMNRVRIKNGYVNSSNVTVLKFMIPDKLLEKIYSYGDVWSNSVGSLTEAEYNRLFVRSGIKN